MGRPGLCLGLCLGMCVAGAVMAQPGIVPAQRADQQPAEPRQEGPTRTALMVFIDYEDHVQPSLGAAELRLSGARGLAEWLADQGHEVVSYPEIEPIMRSWQVRSANDLPWDLLHALGAEWSVDFLTIARVVIYPDRVLLLARGLDRTTGHLCWSGAAEEPLPDDLWARPERASAAWSRLVRKAGDQLATRWPDPADASIAAELPRLVLLPLRAVGLGTKSADVATFAILGSLLEPGRWRIPDPSLVESVLRVKGYDPHLLDEPAREELTIWFRPAALLAPELVSFESLRTQNQPFADDFDAPSGVSLAAEARVPLYLQVLIVDCRTGRVRSARSAYLEPDDPTGLFGFTRRVPLARRFEGGADKIVEQMEVTEGEI